MKAFLNARKNSKADSEKKICKRGRSLYTRNWFLDWEKEMQKKGFTLVEVLIVIFVISTALILIIRGISETHRYISETAQKTIAINLAKEGIEAVYNLRNSNWRKRSDKKNSCWLLSDPKKECKIENWIRHGKHTLAPADNSQKLIYQWEAENTIKSYKESLIDLNTKELQQTYPRIKGQNTQVANAPYQVYFLHYFPGSGWIDFWTYKTLSAEQLKKENFSLGVYARYLFIESPYNKNTGKQYNYIKPTENKITQGQCKDPWCQDNSPKEVRFCSIVHYIAPYQGNVFLCSIMTNFEQ